MTSKGVRILKALERLKVFLEGKKITGIGKKFKYEDTRITTISEKKSEEMYVKIEFVLESGRVFLKKFNRRSSEYLNKWAHKKIGDEVTLLIRPDGIIKDIF